MITIRYLPIEQDLYGAVDSIKCEHIGFRTKGLAIMGDNSNVHFYIPYDRVLRAYGGFNNGQ